MNEVRDNSSTRVVRAGLLLLAALAVSAASTAAQNFCNEIGPLTTQIVRCEGAATGGLPEIVDLCSLGVEGLVLVLWANAAQNFAGTVQGKREGTLAVVYKLSDKGLTQAWSLDVGSAGGSIGFHRLRAHDGLTGFDLNVRSSDKAASESSIYWVTPTGIGPRIERSDK